jgi:hypothetical protein
MNYLSLPILHDHFTHMYPHIVSLDPQAMRASADRKVRQFSKHLNSVGFLAGYTCPGATLRCMSKCYTQVFPSHSSNSEGLKAQNTWILLRLLTEGDVEGLTNQFKTILDHSYDQFHRYLGRKMTDPKILANQKRMARQGPIWRWQWSGDVVDENHAIAIRNASASYPEVSLYLYTRSFHALGGFYPKPDNLTIWLSSDADNADLVEQIHRQYPWTRIAAMKETPLVEDRICPENTGKLPLEGACAACGICWKAQGRISSIVFPERKPSGKHYTIHDPLLKTFHQHRQEKGDVFVIPRSPITLPSNPIKEKVLDAEPEY